MVRLGQKIIALTVDKIAYFFSEQKLTYIVTTDNKKFPMDQPLDEIMDVLDPRIFFRINRQYIITFTSIAEIHPYFKGRVKLMLQPQATEDVIISAERTPEFKRWIDQKVETWEPFSPGSVTPNPAPSTPYSIATQLTAL